MNKKHAVILIFCGIGILISSVIFSQGYIPKLGFLGSLNDMQVVIIEGKYIQQQDIIIGSSVISKGHGYWEGRFEFPLKYSLLMSLFLILFGAAFIFLKKVSDK